eukprot:365050-Chlamydomonas_euryale.AAC.1
MGDGGAAVGVGRCPANGYCFAVYFDRTCRCPLTLVPSSPVVLVYILAWCCAISVIAPSWFMPGAGG